jgi:superfamily I DNA/RNA helicase
VVLQQAKYGTQLVFVGDTQQQIYEWRGAVNALARIEDAERTLLTLSFRFGPEVAAVANGCLERVGADLRIEGAGRPGYVREIAQPRAVLCRSNAEALSRVLQALEDGRRPYLVGEGRELVAFAKAVNDLRTNGWTSHPELACFTSWGQVQDYVATDPQGSELALLVKLVEQYGTDTIIEALSNQVPEDQCDLVISTAHKAKGCQWPTVQLASDFPEPSADGLDVSEWRLLYVAVTRAQEGLDITGVAALNADGPGAADATVPADLAGLVAEDQAELIEAQRPRNELDYAAADCAAEAAEIEAYGFRRPGLT